MKFFFVSSLVFVLLSSAFVSASRSQPDKEKTDELFKELFLTTLQRHLHEGDMEAAKLAATRPPSGSNDFYRNYADAPIKKNLEQLTHTSERLTEESYSLKSMDDLELFKQIFSASPVDKESAREEISVLQNRIQTGEKFLLQFETTLNAESNKNPESTEEEQRTRDVDKKMETQMLSLKRGILDNIPRFREKIEAIENAETNRLEFIQRHPKYFLKKKHFSEDQFGLASFLKSENLRGDGQTIAVLDSFSKAMPERLKSKCVNSDQFTNEHEDNLEGHGVAVASVAVGMARNAKFRAIHLADCYSKIVGKHSELPEDVPVLPIAGPELTETEIRALGIFVWNGVQRIAVKSQSLYYIIDLTSGHEFPETIVNISSWPLIDTPLRKRSQDLLPTRLPILVGLAATLHRWIKNRKAIVVAAGNCSIVLGSSKTYSLLRAFSKLYPQSFIVAVGLESNHMAVSKFSNQPGDHPIQNVSLCALGEGVRNLKLDGSYKLSVGTSFSAPIISGAIALLASNYPDATMQNILQALLHSASPVVMRKSQNRFYSSPYLLRDVNSGSLLPGTHSYIKKNGQLALIEVTAEMIKEGRQRYGAGILNVLQAMKHLDINFKRRTE